MRDTTTKSYPTIAQGFGLIGLFVLLSISQSPFYMLLSKVVDKEFSMLVFYVIVAATILWIACVYKKVIEGTSSSFNLHLSNWQILPFIIIGELMISMGISEPITELIPMPEIFKTFFLEMSLNANIFTFFMLVIAAPLFEEALFRGVILEGLLKQYSP